MESRMIQIFHFQYIELYVQDILFTSLFNRNDIVEVFSISDDIHNCNFSIRRLIF